MDPNATYELFEEAMAQQDAEAIREHAEALAQWLDIGGALPTGMRIRGFNPHTAREYFRDISRVARCVGRTDLDLGW